MARFCALALILCACVLAPGVRAAGPGTGSGPAGDWPRWRGPEATGVAPDATPPLTWSATQNVQWKTPLPGRSSATPIVWGDRVFAVSAVELDAAERAAGATTHKFLVFCLDRASGRIVWQHTACEAAPHEGLHQTNTYASGSPTTDGERLYVTFGSFGIYCYTLEGEPLWSRDLGDMTTRNGFGEGASPTIHQGRLIVPWDHEGPSFLVALDAKTGKDVWRVDRDEPTTWTTPLVVDAAGATQVILNGTNRVRSYDFATGKLIWECGGQVTNPIPTPVTLDGVVYCMSGHRGSFAAAIPLDARGDVTGSPSLRWTKSRGTPYVPSPLLYGDRLYYLQRNDAILTCLDARTGEPHYQQERLQGVSAFYASPVGAAGRVYLTARDGTTLVLADADTLEILATNPLDEPVDASPAIAGDQVFLRGESHLYAISESAPRQE